MSNSTTAHSAGNTERDNMTDQLIIREYNDNDREAVMHLFRLNTPGFFSPEEENDLLFYLENEIEYYFVVEVNKQIVGSGGFNFSEDTSTARISWDIVHPGFQQKSLGRKLLDFRIRKLGEFEALQRITVRTSQHAYGFYEKQRFKLLLTEKDYWAKGFDLYVMEYMWSP